MKKFFVAPLLFAFLAALSFVPAQAQKKNVIDEVVWMVGDEPILRSDIEAEKINMKMLNMGFDGDPDCFIPEQIAIHKLFLNQAKIDSIQVDDIQVNRFVESRLQYLVNQAGSREKLEEYYSKKYSQIREDLRHQVKNNNIIEQMQNKIASDVKVSPSEIRKFFESMPVDSLPFIPTTVEVQIITSKPQVSMSEIDAIKERLREFSDEINSGKRDFSTIARLYSDDRRTAAQGGEYGFTSKSVLESDFAGTVFNLTDTKKVSPIVKTEEGYHIVQLIERRGDLVNFRQILLRPAIADSALQNSISKLDSIKTLIGDNKLTFEKAVDFFSDDNNTRNNQGLMVNNKNESAFSGSSMFTYEELPQDISRKVYGMKKGEVSAPFIMTNDKGVKEVAIIKLKNITEGHKANMNADFQKINELAIEKKRNEVLDSWIRRKQKETYVFINERYRDCKFKYPNWVHKDM